MAAQKASKTVTSASDEGPKIVELSDKSDKEEIPFIRPKPKQEQKNPLVIEEVQKSMLEQFGNAQQGMLLS